MLLPFLTDGLDLKQIVSGEVSNRKEVFSPRTQRAAQPAINGYAKTHFWSLYQFRRDIFVEHLPENPFAGPIADLEVQRQLPRELHHTMVQQRDACFKTY